jgi:hypothetical protein
MPQFARRKEEKIHPNSFKGSFATLFYRSSLLYFISISLLFSSLIYLYLYLYLYIFIFMGKLRYTLYLQGGNISNKSKPLIFQIL